MLWYILIMKKKKLKVIILVVLLLILLAGLSYVVYHNLTKESYSFKDDKLVYEKNRGKPEFEMFLKQKNETFDIYNVIYQSRNFLTYKTTIHGLLFLPKTEGKVPGVVLLPGGGVTKESEGRVAEIIANLGYAVLTIDQRGIGETGGYYLGIQEDYGVFAKGDEPIQFLSVYDALKAFDVMRKIESIDSSNIIMSGESMGGRYSMIAAALDDRIKGYVGISTSGFHYKEENMPYDSFLSSIDADNYVKMISPRDFIMIHATNDSTIKIEDAKLTFDNANEPKKFFRVEGCGHGYCDKMYEPLKQSLEWIFKK